jgi:enoyl-CoA hydratase/carnithine racemase
MPGMSHPPLSGPPQLRIEGARAILQLQRPAHHNRIEADDLPVLQSHLVAVEADPALRVLVLTGSGEASFCSGYNLATLTELGTDADADAASTAVSTAAPTLDGVIDQLEHLRLPTICALNGSVYGGGTDLALACDFRVGVEGSRLVMPATRIGLHYYANGMRRYVERLGVANAKRLFLLGESVPAEELLAMGYLTALVPPAQLQAAVDALAERLAGNPPTVTQDIKRHLNALASGHFDAAAITRDHRKSLASTDLREGLQAMREKRPPKFTGG